MARKIYSLQNSAPEDNNKKITIPKRYIFALLAFLGMVTSFAMRVNLSIAIVAMVENSAVRTEHPGIYNDSDRLELRSQANKRKYEGPKYNWDTRTQGYILGAYFYGYLFLQIPAGLISQKLGAKWVYGSSIVFTAILCILTPLAATYGASIMITVQLLQGLMQGALYPSLCTLVNSWAPLMERSRITTFIFSGSSIGMVIALMTSGALCASDLFGGWPSTFYLFGTTGCIWFLFWGIYGCESPFTHPNISEEELALFETSKCVSHKMCETPWMKIFVSVPVWSSFAAFVGFDWGYTLFITEIPTYISNILRYSIEADGLISSAQHFAYCTFAWVTSYVADKLRESNRMNITNIRKLFTSIGLLGPAACLLGVTMLECQQEAIVALLTMTMLLKGSCSSGSSAIFIDMCPDFAGTLYALSNIVAFALTAACPVIVGIFTESGETVENWNKVFYLTAAIYIVMTVIFDAFVSSELQAWGIRDSGYECVKGENRPVNEENFSEGKQNENI